MKRLAKGHKHRPSMTRDVYNNEGNAPGIGAKNGVLLAEGHIHRANGAYGLRPNTGS